MRMLEIGRIGPLWIVFAAGLLFAGGGRAATINLTSAGPVGIAGDLILLRPEIQGPSLPVTAGPGTDHDTRKAAEIVRLARCVVAGGATLVTLGAGTGARAALGQCIVASSPNAFAAGNVAVPLFYSGWVSNGPAAPVLYPRVPGSGQGGTALRQPIIRPPLPPMAPVPVPASAIALLTALALLFRFRSKTA